ncbi:MAG: DMT family transporter [Clostridiales Family XIII bacterium]|jgi:drug/metabolite transporter (DMT)-like permease|nr:DMT family transporter [Clostridiales Family XIII bacterium]
MSRRTANLLILVASLTGAAAFLFTKVVVGEMGPSTLIVFRFCIGFLLLLPFFGRRIRRANRATLRYALILGVLHFALVFAFNIAMQTATASIAGFICNAATILAPLANAALIRKAPHKLMVLAFFVALVGLFLLAGASGRFSFGSGEGVCVIVALLYTAQILLNDRIPREADPVSVGVLLIGICGLCAIPPAAIAEGFAFHLSLPGLWSLIGLTVLSTVVCQMILPVAQRYTTVDRTGFLIATEPIFAALLGVFVLHESLSTPIVFGMACVMAGILLSLLVRSEKTLV